MARLYKLTTLLWLHGHGGAEFEVWDDLSPFGKPGGLAMRGKVRNWARLVNGKSKYDRKAVPNPNFTSIERSIVAEAAGRVTDTPQRVPSSGDQACGGRSHGLSGTNRDRAMDAARSWFERAGKDFRLVCNLAGLDAQAVRAKAAADIESAAAPRAPRNRLPLCQDQTFKF